MKIRKASKNDLKRVVNVTNRAFNLPYDPEGYTGAYKEPYDRLQAAFSDGAAGVLVATRGGKIIGAIRYSFPRKGRLHIFKLAVLKAFRNKSVAQTLMAKAEQVGRKAGCKRVTLDCMLEKGLVPYYEKLGFSLDRIYRHLDHYDVYMSKRI